MPSDSKHPRAFSIFRMPSLGGQTGMALILVLLILLAISIMAIGLNINVVTDTEIAGNLRKQAINFNTAESGLYVSPEVLAYSVDQRGDETATSSTWTDSFTFGANSTCTATIQVSAVGDALYLDGGNATLSCNSTQSRTSVKPIGVEWAKGGAIQMAAGYEGLGKGAAGAGAVRWYGMTAAGSQNVAESGQSDIGESYRYVIGTGGR